MCRVILAKTKDPVKDLLPRELLLLLDAVVDLSSVSLGTGRPARGIDELGNRSDYRSSDAKGQDGVLLSLPLEIVDESLHVTPSVGVSIIGPVNITKS